MLKTKLTAWMMAMLLVCSLTACGNGTNMEEPEAQEPGISVSEESGDSSEDDLPLEMASDPVDVEEDTQNGQEEDREPASGESAAEAGDTDEQQSVLAEETAANIEQQAAAAGSNTLIVYFSRHGSSIGDTDADAVSSASLSPGNVILVANMAEQLTGADTFQIVTIDPYPKDYRETTNVARVELDNAERPALSTQISNMDDYDTIILGYPNWWGTIPMPVATFLESYDLSGKTILPYCVHEGSGLGSSVSDITALAPGSTVLSGLSISTSRVSASNDDVAEWLRGHGVIV